MVRLTARTDALGSVTSLPRNEGPVEWSMSWCTNKTIAQSKASAYVQNREFLFVIAFVLQSGVCYYNQGPVSPTSRNLFGPERALTKLLSNFFGQDGLLICFQNNERQNGYEVWWLSIHKVHRELCHSKKTRKVSGLSTGHRSYHNAESLRPVFGFFDDDYEQITFINTCSTGPTLHTPHELTGAFSGALVWVSARAFLSSIYGSVAKVTKWQTKSTHRLVILNHFRTVVTKIDMPQLCVTLYDKYIT